LTRGKEKVLGETYLMFTTYNLRRIVSILEFNEVMAKIKALNLSFYQFLALSLSITIHSTKYFYASFKLSLRFE
jgi:hypothetical protein